MQSYNQIITTNKPTHHFLKAGCPSCHPTNSVRAVKGNCTQYYCFGFLFNRPIVPQISLQVRSGLHGSLNWNYWCEILCRPDVSPFQQCLGQLSLLLSTHTHSVLTATFPGEPGLAGCPLNSPSPFIPALRTLLGQA